MARHEIVPAGPAPGRYCDIVGTYSIGTDVSLEETIPAGNTATVDIDPGNTSTQTILEVTNTNAAGT